MRNIVFGKRDSCEHRLSAPLNALWCSSAVIQSTVASEIVFRPNSLVKFIFVFLLNPSQKAPKLVPVKRRLLSARRLSFDCSSCGPPKLAFLASQMCHLFHPDFINLQRWPTLRRWTSLATPGRVSSWEANYISQESSPSILARNLLDALPTKGACVPGRTAEGIQWPWYR